MLDKQLNYLNFQNKKMYNFSSKNYTSNIGNIYAYLLVNKLTQLHFYNHNNINMNNFFLAKTINIKKDIEFDSERLNILLKRNNTNSSIVLNYSKIGYNKFSIYNIFSNLKINRFFLNEKKYQKIFALRGYNIFETGMRKYSENLNKVKTYNNYFSLKIFDIKEKKNIRIHKNAEICAYFTKKISPLFEEKTINSGRIYLNMWDELEDNTIIKNLNDFADREYLDIKNNEKLTKILRDYEMYYGLKFYQKEMQESIWKLNLGKRMYLSIFSKNAVRVNFLRDVTMERYGLNTRSGAKKEFGLLRSLYTKHLFPRNIFELEKGFETFNIFSTNKGNLDINLINKIKKTNIDVENIKNLERIFLKKNKNILIKTVTPIKNLSFFKKNSKKVQKIKIIYKNKKNITWALNNILNLKILRKIKKQKSLTFRLIFKKFNILFLKKNHSKLMLKTRLFLNKKQLQTLLINAMFNILPYEKLKKFFLYKKSKQLGKEIEIEFGAACLDGWANATFLHKDSRLKSAEYIITKLSSVWGEAFTNNHQNLNKEITETSQNLNSIKDFLLENKNYKKIHHIGSKVLLKNTLSDSLYSEYDGILKLINLKKDFKKILAFKSRMLIKSNEYLLHKKILNKKLITIYIIKNINKEKNKIITNSNTKISNHYVKKLNSTLKIIRLRNQIKKQIYKKILNILENKIPFWQLNPDLDSENSEIVKVINNGEENNNSILELSEDLKIINETTYVALKDLKYNIAGETLKKIFSINLKRASDIEFNFSKWNSNSLLFNKYNYRTKLNNRDILTGSKIFLVKFFKINLNKFKKITQNSKKYIEILPILLFKKNIKNKNSKVIEIKKKQINNFILKKVYKIKNFKKIEVLQKQKFRLKFFKEILNVKIAAFTNSIKILKKLRKKILDKYLGISSYINKFNIYNNLKKFLLKTFETSDSLRGVYEDGRKVKNITEIHLNNKINNVYKKYTEIANSGIQGVTIGIFWSLFGENTTIFGGPIKLLNYSKLFANTLSRLFLLKEKDFKQIGYNGKFDFLHRYEPKRYEFKYEFGLQKSLWAKDRVSELKFFFKKKKNIKLKMTTISETYRSKYPSAAFLRHMEIADRYFDQRCNLSLSYDSHSKIPSLLFWEDIKMTLGEILQPTQLYKRIRVYGKAAIQKNIQIPWKYKTPRHLFLKARHKQFGMRKFPIFWYRIMRKKYPLKSQKKEWAIKIPLAERLAPFNKLIKTTIFDSSLSYYKHLGWTSMTKEMRRVRNMNYFYRYGRSGTFNGEVPLACWFTKNKIPSIDIAQESFLKEKDEDSISIFRNNLTEFVSPLNSENSKNLNTFFHIYGKESLISFGYYFQSYKDSLKKWHSKMKPTLGYFGIKTYYTYNSYVMQINNEIKTRRYKTIFNNYSFSTRINKTEFTKNLVFINFTKIAKEAYTQFNTKLYDNDINKLYTFSNAFKYLVRNFKSKYRFYSYSGYDTLTFNKTEMLPASLTVNNRNYFTDDKLLSVNYTITESKNKARTVKTFENFKFKNKINNSTVLLQSLFNNASLRQGLKNFTATNLLW